MREKKFGKRCLTWVLVLMMTISLLPVSALAKDGEGTYRVNITIWNLPIGASSIENVTATLTGSSGTYSATVDSVSAFGMISVSNVPKGKYNIQITGVGNDGVAVKTTAFLLSSDFNDTSGLASVVIMGGWVADVNDAVTLSFSFNNPKKALDGQNYAFQNITAYLIAAADYTSGDTSKRYPLTLSSTGYMSAQVPANQEYKLVAEGWTYAAIDNSSKDLTKKYSFDSIEVTISQKYTDRDRILRIPVPEESISIEEIEANWIEVPIKIEDSGKAESYTVVIQDERGREYSATTTTGESVIKIPAASNISYRYTVTLTSSDGRSIIEDRYSAGSFYTVKAGSDGSVAATLKENGTLILRLSDDYVTVTVNIYGDDKLVFSETKKQARDSVQVTSTETNETSIAALKKAELFVNNEELAEGDQWFFNKFNEGDIPPNATIRADFYYEYTDAETEYTVTIHHQFVDTVGNIIKDEMSEEKHHAGDVLNILKQTEHGEDWISQETKKIVGYRNVGAWELSRINEDNIYEKSSLIGQITVDRNRGIVDGTMPHVNIGITFIYHYVDNYIEYIANANNAVGEMYVDWCNSNETKTVKKINNGKDNYYSRSGYEFVSWNTKSDGSGTTYNPGDSITLNGKPVTLYAQWKRIYRPNPPTPTVEILDEDALGLNTDDHFAYIIGYPDGTVQPNGQITRAEATTIFFRLLTEESRSANLTKTNGYTDVASDAWYNTAVSTMTKAGIVDGYPDGTFRPDAPITRAEMAKIISLFAKLDKSESRFSDIAGHWAEAYIRLAAGNGWIAGYPDGTFGPQRNISRAETATMINRVLERVPSAESRLLSRDVMQIWPDANPGDWFYLAMQEATNSHDYERNAKWAAADEQWTALRETRDWKALEQ